MKQVTYTSKDNLILFIWTEKYAAVKNQDLVVQEWNTDRRQDVPTLERFERVAENFLAAYDAIYDRLHLPFNKNFFQEEWQRVPTVAEDLP